MSLREGQVLGTQTDGNYPVVPSLPGGIYGIPSPPTQDCELS